MISMGLLLDRFVGSFLLSYFNEIEKKNARQFFLDSHRHLAHIAVTAMTPNTPETKMTKTAQTTAATKTTKTAASTKPAVLTVAQYAKQHKTSPKVVRRQLRAVATKPSKGWLITPALARKLAA